MPVLSLSKCQSTEGKSAELLTIVIVLCDATALTLLVGPMEEHRACKNRMMSCWRDCLE